MSHGSRILVPISNAVTYGLLIDCNLEEQKISWKERHAHFFITSNRFHRYGCGDELELGSAGIVAAIVPSFMSRRMTYLMMRCTENFKWVKL